MSYKRTYTVQSVLLGFWNKAHPVLNFLQAKCTWSTEAIRIKFTGDTHMFPVQFLFPAALMIHTKVPPSTKSTIKNIQADAIVVFYIFLFYIH